MPAAFDRDAYYDFPDDPWRFAVFCRVALAALERDGVPLDVLHVHDWHTGPALLERARGEAAGNPFFTGMAAMVTLHNLAYHGWTGNEKLDQLGLRPGDPFGGDNSDGIDLLLTAIDRADLANTVSPGYARESLTPEFGMGLDGALRAKGDRYLGILNGIDPDVWNPATDEALAVPYDLASLKRKAACRADLLERNGMDPADDGIVLGMIGRLDPQKGFDLLADGAPALLEAGARIIVQGSGHASLADPFRALVAANPGRVTLIERFDREMARRIYARLGRVPHAVTVRAVRAGPDDLAALRHAAGRPADGRPRGFGARRGRASGRGDGLRVRRRDARGPGRRRRPRRRAAHRQAGVDRAPGTRHAGRLQLGHGVRARRTSRRIAGRSRSGATAGEASLTNFGDPRVAARARIRPPSRPQPRPRPPEAPMPRQFVVQVPNRPGQMADLAEQMAAAGVDLRAIGGGGLGDYGHFILTSADDDAARRVLEEGNWTFIEGESLLAEVDDKPGGMAKLARALADAGVNVHGHLFLGRWSDRATFAFVVDDPEKARPILEKN